VETIVTLSQMRQEFATQVPRDHNILARELIAHFLPVILSERDIEIILDDGGEIHLKEFFRQHNLIDFQRVPFIIGQRNFTLLSVKLRPKSGFRHRLILAASAREVRGDALEKFIPVLAAGSLQLEGEPDGFIFVSVVEGEFLDEKVDPMRVSFTDDDDIEEEVSVEEPLVPRGDLFGEPQSSGRLLTFLSAWQTKARFRADRRTTASILRGASAGGGTDGRPAATTWPLPAFGPLPGSGDHDGARRSGLSGWLEQCRIPLPQSLPRCSIRAGGPRCRGRPAGTVLSQNLLQPVLYGGLGRAEYTIGVASCGKLDPELSGSRCAWLRSVPAPRHLHYVFSAVGSAALPSARRWYVHSVSSAADPRRQRAFDSPLRASSLYLPY
jgi:hypothetical protein